MWNTVNKKDRDNTNNINQPQSIWSLDFGLGSRLGIEWIKGLNCGSK